jgi:type IV pilus assembly protein PilE
MDRSKGFTLLELVIAMTITTILAVLAVSSYQRYAFRARRADARQMLMAIAHGEERWYATYNRYTDDLSKFGYGQPAVSPHAYYEAALTVEGDDAQSYVVSAMPIDKQANDACGTMTIDSAGSKLPDGTDLVTNANGNCW